MIPFHRFRDPESGEDIVETPLSGALLLEVPMLNKGSGFTPDERREFGLLGILPPHSSTPEEQVARAYHNFQSKGSDLERYVFLASLQDRNETLFYRLLAEHTAEMMPIVYTPTVGKGCQLYSHLYRRPRGLYLAYPHRDQLDLLLKHAPYRGVRVIVVTDGERILGLGDLGVGGMGIPVGKLALYTLCAGIHPSQTLPIVLDVGTDNLNLLEDPLYLGWRHERIRGEEYDEFVEDFVSAVERVFPGVLLQWEDFAKGNARRLLDRYRDRICSFNDDIQGTGAVAAAGLMAALEASGSKWRDQRIVLHGGGSAGTGIGGQIVMSMVDEGLTEAEAVERIWMLDSRGLVHAGREEKDAAKRRFSKPTGALAGWEIHDAFAPGLEEVVRRVKPTMLVGASADPGCFNERVVREMARNVERPVIFPLSNPTSKAEAKPADLLAWTEGRALIGTGSPFADVEYEGRVYKIGQCNNVFIFPGVGLGVLACGARRVTERMFHAAARALGAIAPALRDRHAPLYPGVADARLVARRVALAVGLEAAREGAAESIHAQELERRIDQLMWEPKYPRLRHRPEK
ncbi:MAG TPA: NAD-dependent malic enzyme [Candidatus Polarisedimenticolaceae bacterium]